MAIKMTREEYKQKYGQEPFASVSDAVSALPSTSQASKPKERGLIESTVKRPFERLVLEPARRFGEAVGSLATPFMNDQQKSKFSQISQEDKSINIPILGEFKTRGVKPGMEGAKQIAGEAAETAGYLIPGAPKGASLGAKTAVGAGTGYAFDVGAKLQEGQKVSDALTPGVGTAAGAILPALTGVIGNFPKRMEQANLRMSPMEKANLAKKGKDVAGYLASKKIVGNPESRYAKVSKLYEKMEDAVGSRVEKSGLTYNKKQLLDDLAAVPEQMADDPAGYGEAVSAMDKIIKFVQDKAPDEIPAKLVNTYKRNLWKRAYSKNNTDVTNEAYHAGAELLKSKLDEGIPGLNALNKEYGNIIDARRVLFKALGRPQVSTTGKILGTAAGAGIGATMGGGVGAAGGAIVGEKIAEKAFGTATRSAMGAGVQAVQDLVSKIPVDKTGNLQITQKALISLLERYVR